ncbi:UPF0676 protein [Anabarilius grahami]|uniref:UPF0676 protein n=1 Tax=Anabarilius grahami TaxID=495550 RepID=A0A3N0YBJ4_ANAGA|nr:UPF0676 protein [Anabarilius grahami]
MSIPVLDFSAYELGKANVSDADLEKLTKELRKAFIEVEKVMSVSKKFFSLPENKKKPFSRGSFSCNVNHGWVSLETERHNWPSEGVDDFQDAQVKFFHRCKELALKVLRLMAVGLGLDSEVFVNEHKHIGSHMNATSLRSLYYPPVDSTRVKENQVRCGEHSDYGSITLLFQSTEGGLQVQNRAEEFVSAPCIPGTVLVNIADLMQRWTSDVYVSVVHRVLLPPAGVSRTRQSLAFFVQPDDESVITCCDGSDKYPPIKSVDYLLSRFNDTYGKKTNLV